MLTKTINGWAFTVYSPSFYRCNQIPSVTVFFDSQHNQWGVSDAKHSRLFGSRDSAFKKVTDTLNAAFLGVM